MAYVIPLLIVVLLVAGFVTFLVINATRRSRGAGRSGKPATPGTGEDATPLGDTAEHAGRQGESGRTVGRPDAGSSGGTARPVQSGYDNTGATGADTDGETAHVRRSGEGEGAERIEFEDVEPEGASARRGSAAAPASDAAGEREAEAADDRERDDVAQRREEPEGDRLRREREDDDRSRPASERLADRGF